MAKGQFQSVVREIRQLATVHNTADQSDGDLLRAFLSDNDQPAFSALVGRHAAMVLSVCRRVLHHTQDSEDAFQATFLLLARQAASIRKTASLAAWLHGVAYRMATNARRAASRRRNRENQSPSAPAANPAWSAAWREVQAVLDEEIERLPEIYRQPFVLCCLENRSGAEVAQQLGQKEGTVHSRVARARKKLQERLAKRGVSLAAVLGAAALSGNTALSAAPAALIASTVQAATHLAAAPAPGVAALLEGANPALALPKVKTAVLLLLSTLAVGVAGAVMPAQREAVAVPEDSQQVAAPPQGQPKEAPPAKPDVKTPRQPKSLEENPDAVTVGGRVLDPEGKPFTGAKLYLWVDYNFEKPVPPKVRATSGPDGRFDFTFAKQDVAAIEEPWVNDWAAPWRQALVLAAAPGYGAGWANMAAFEKGEVALRLVKDDVPVQGRLRDLQGRPVVGAVVQVRSIGSLYRPRWAGLKESVTTDRDGRFILTGIGHGREATLRIASATTELLLPGVNTGTAAGATLDLVAGPTKPVEGTVRARDTGRPLGGVVVLAKHADFNIMNDDPHGVRAVTDDQGRYRLEGLPKAKQYEVTVQPRPDQGYLSATQWVADTQGLKPIPLDFTLRRGVTVRFRLIDKETRQPIRGLMQYTLARDNPLWPEAVAPYNPQLILPPRVWFPGHTTDKDGFIQFVAYLGRGAIFASAGRGSPPYFKARLDPEDEKKGYYPLSKGEPNNGFLHLSNGYRVIDTDRTDKPLTFDIEFSRGRDVPGKLLGPDGKPVLGATAYGLTFDAALLYRDGREPPLEQQVLKTDGFTALGVYPKEPRTLSFGHKDRKLIGYMVVNGTEEGPLRVRLEAWGALTGRLVDEQGKPVAGALLRLHYPELPRPGLLWHDLEFRTDPQGRFRVQCLLPRQEHGLSVVGDAKRAITPTAPEKLTRLSVAAGAVQDLGDVKVKAVAVKKVE
jgi:RNA polymerase sigma factor (sigma-70 family)